MEDRSYKKGTTVSANDITVHQLYTDDELAVPAIVLKLVSNRDSPAAIKLRVPEPTAQRVGFHPEFENDAWDITDDGLVFETTLQPENELTTLYAVETDEEDVVGDAMDTLEIVSVEQVEGEDSQAQADTTETPATEDVDPDETLVDVSQETGDAESESEIDPEHDLIDLDEGEKGVLATDFDLGVDEIDTEVTMQGTEETAAEEEFEDLSAEGTTEGEPMDEPERPHDMEQRAETNDELEGDNQNAQTMESATTDVAASDPPVLSEYTTDELVDELTRRAEQSELAEREQDQLAAISDEQSGRGDVRDAQITNLQSRVSDVEAFTDTLEGVLEQHGPPADVLSEYNEQLNAMESHIESLSNEMADTTEAVSAIQPRIDEVEGELSAVESDVNEIDDQLETTTEDIETVRTDLKDVERGQAALESDVKTLQKWRGKITGALEAFTGE